MIVYKKRCNEKQISAEMLKLAVVNTACTKTVAEINGTQIR